MTAPPRGRSRSCSSPGTPRPTASARSRACTSCENVEFALFGGPSKHGGEAFAGERAGVSLPPPAGPPARAGAARGERALPRRRLLQRRARRARRDLGGRAPRRAAADPVDLAMGASAQSRARAQLSCALRRLYRSADAVVTYGPHVSAYVGARGARNVHIAPQAVDNSFWSAPDVGPPRWPASADAGVGPGSASRAGPRRPRRSSCL